MNQGCITIHGIACAPANTRARVAAAQNATATRRTSLKIEADTK